MLQQTDPTSRVGCGPEQRGWSTCLGWTWGPRDNKQNTSTSKFAACWMQRCWKSLVEGSERQLSRPDYSAAEGNDAAVMIGKLFITKGKVSDESWFVIIHERGGRGMEDVCDSEQISCHFHLLFGRWASQPSVVRSIEIRPDLACQRMVFT